MNLFENSYHEPFHDYYSKKVVFQHICTGTQPENLVFLTSWTRSS